jgi:hypothetical protein
MMPRYENANTVNIIHKLVTVFARASVIFGKLAYLSPKPGPRT